MMRRASCNSCNSVQPADWSVGDTCYNCGEQARTDVACAWCCHYVPDAKFCRDCGFEMVEPELFAVARMLKSSNIDKLSLPAKTRELPADHADHYRSMYNRDYAILMTRVEELRLAEQYLIAKDYSFELELDYLDKLPLDDDTKAFLSKGPKGPFQDRPARLIDIIADSPIEKTRWLAQLALLRQTEFTRENSSTRDDFRLLTGAISTESSDKVLAEVFAGLSNWTILPSLVSGRQRFYKTEINPALEKTIAEKAPALWETMSEAAQRATAPLFSLLTNLDEKLTYKSKRALEAAKTSQDPDLVFSAQLVGKEGLALLERVYKADKRTPDAKAEMAASFIAFYQMPQLFDLLTAEAAESLRQTALSTLLATADGQFEDHSLRALLSVLKTEPEASLKSKIQTALTGTDYEDDANRISLSQDRDNPDALIDMLKRSSNIAPILDALKAHEITPILVETLARKLRDVEIGTDWVSRIWAMTEQASDRSNMQRALIQFFRQLFLQKNADSYAALRCALPDILQAKPNAIGVMKSAVASDFKPSYLAALRKEVMSFSPTAEQLSGLTKSTEILLRDFGSGLRTANKPEADYLIRYVWTAHEGAWIETALAYPLAIPSIVNGLQAIASNSEIWENSRNSAVKGLIALAPKLEAEARENMVSQMENLGNITPAMHSQIPKLRLLG